MIDTCNREEVRLLIFSNPCNPTSLVLKREQVRQLARELDNTLVVLAAVAISAIFIGGLDSLLGLIVRFALQG